MDVRLAALKSIIKIFEKNTLIDDTIKHYESQVFIPSELKSLVTGVVKHKRILDFYIEKISSKPFKNLNIEVKNILRLAIYELEYSDNPEYAVINSYVELSKQYNSKVSSFINGVLRNFTREKNNIILPDIKSNPIQAISIIYSHPEWMVKNWIKNYGIEDTIEICKFNNSIPKLTVRINHLKTSKEKLINIFKDDKINFSEVRMCLDCLNVSKKGHIKEIPGFHRGLWVIQSESSALVSRILAPEKNEKILDLCAAPGGKTSHIASLMENTGEIIAVDISETRLKKIEENIKRLGITNVRTQVGDAKTFTSKTLFDRILIDAPCSNTGVLSKRAEAKWNKKPEDITNLAKIQYEILSNAAKLVKTDGIIVYSTCSIEPEENINVIKKFLENNKNFELDNISSYLPWESDNQGYIQILQSKHNIDGFFIAKLKKTN